MNRKRCHGVAPSTGRPPRARTAVPEPRHDEQEREREVAPGLERDHGRRSAVRSGTGTRSARPSRATAGPQAFTMPNCGSSIVAPDEGHRHDRRDVRKQHHAADDRPAAERLPQRQRRHQPTRWSRPCRRSCRSAWCAATTRTPLDAEDLAEVVQRVVAEEPGPADVDQPHRLERHRDRPDDRDDTTTRTTIDRRRDQRQPALGPPAARRSRGACRLQTLRASAAASVAPWCSGRSPSDQPASDAGSTQALVRALTRRVGDLLDVAWPGGVVRRQAAGEHCVSACGTGSSPSVAPTSAPLPCGEAPAVEGVRAVRRGSCRSSPAIDAGQRLLACPRRPWQAAPGVDVLGRGCPRSPADRDLALGRERQPVDVGVAHHVLDEVGRLRVGVGRRSPTRRSRRTGPARARRARERRHDPGVLRRGRTGRSCTRGQVGSASFRRPASSSRMNDDQMIMAALPAK